MAELKCVSKCCLYLPCQFVASQNQGEFSKLQDTILLPPNRFASWLLLNQKIQPSQRAKEGSIYYLQQGEHWGTFPKHCLPEQPNWGSFKLTWRGLIREFNIVLWQSPSLWLKSQGSENVNIIIPSSTCLGTLGPAELKDILCMSLKEEPGLYFIPVLLFLEFFSSVPAFLHFP